MTGRRIAAHPRVPAGRLRRRRGPRRLPGPRAARLVDLDVLCMGGPREGATAHSEHDARFPDGNAALRILSTDLAMTAAVGCGRRGALPHVVRQHGRPPGEAAVRHPARRHRALPRAAAPVEGRAARRRLPRLVVGREDRLRGGRRRGRGEPRHARPTSWRPTPRSTRRGCTSSTTASTPTSTTPTPTPTCSSGIGVDPDRPYVAFVGRITRQKGVPHLLRAGLMFDPACSSCCSPAPPTPRSSRPRPMP